MERRALGPLLRASAIVIAVVAAIDPVIVSNRNTKPTVALTMSEWSSPRDSAFANQVMRVLSAEFSVVRAPVAAAAATVLVGGRLPSDVSELASPAFAVFADRVGPTATLEGVRAPAAAPLNARIVVSPTVRVSGARGRTLDVALRVGGLVVDRATRTISTDDERLSPSLALVPTAAGPAPIRVVASISGSRDSATTDVVVDVRAQRLSVLFFDPRPSWMSTFVRRAIERDPRFVVTSRVVTSRNVGIDAGRPPSGLDDLAVVSSFDAVVVGAPDALAERDVAGLDAYLRRRGGGVVLLLDQEVAGPYERLTNAGPWTKNTDSAVVPIAVAGADSASLRGSEIMWPLRLPATADIIARASMKSKSSAGLAPVVWRSAVGAGRLVVSGALDSWRFRDRSGFDAFWRTLIAESASASSPPVAVRFSNATPSPGEEIDVTVTVRDAALQNPNATRPIRTSVAARLTSSGEPDSSTVVRLWPGDGVGELRGSVRAPGKPGIYQLIVSADRNEAITPLVVVANATHPAKSDRDLVTAWVHARGGQAFSASRLGELSAELRRAIHPAPERESWHPMRSALWIVPFAILLSAEWWLRRRRGLA